MFVIAVLGCIYPPAGVVVATIEGFIELCEYCAEHPNSRVVKFIDKTIPECNSDTMNDFIDTNIIYGSSF